jgi:hypothetical protein
LKAKICTGKGSKLAFRIAYLYIERENAMTKEKAHELIDRMPETFTVDDFIEEMILLQRIEKARKQFADGDFLTEEEVDKEIDRWD